MRQKFLNPFTYSDHYDTYSIICGAIGAHPWSKLMFHEQPYHIYNIYLSRLTQAFHDVACVVLAYQANLSRELSLVGSYDRLLSASSETRRAVLADPRVAIWIEHAQTTLGEHNELSLPQLVWESLVSTYSKCALAVSYIEHTHFSTAVLVDSDGRIALPGCKLIIPAYERRLSTVQVTVEASGRLLVNGHEVAPEYPLGTGVFELGLRETDLQPPPDGAHYVMSSDEILDEKWLEALAEAQRIVSMHNTSWELVRHFGTIIVPIQGGETDTHCSVSFSAKPGVLYMSLGPGRVLAEAMVHESDHQQLYVLKRLLQFWEDPVAEEQAVFRSPWRVDPRPLDGLLRGASAFVRVGSFWTEVISTGNLEQDTDRVGMRATLSLEQSRDAIHLIRQYGHLSFDGHGFIDYLDLQARQELERLQKESYFADWQRRTQQLREAHNTEWQIRYGDRDRIRQQTQ